MAKWDFSGWATRNDLLCSDGRTIKKDAFRENDGKTVPLVWNHQHTAPDDVLGHALLENRPEGVYAYAKFNESDAAKAAKAAVVHGDVSSLSIYANKLLQNANKDVIHGTIREVSLVLAGANPGAFIDNIMAHGDESSDEMIIGYDERIVLYHSEDGEKPESESNDSGKTIGEVFDTLNEEQKTAVYAMIGQILDGDDEGESTTENNKEGSEGGDNSMKHNVFNQTQENSDNVLSHDAMAAIISDAKRFGSLKDSFLEHSAEYGIENIDFLFPDAQNITNTPQMISREMGWVQKVMSGVHHTPFSRIKSIFADITEDEARAKGYTKGKLKKEEVFSLLKRTTTPTTIYKKQKLDRDDVIDITDFDVVAWLKAEMRMMLDEEIARAILIGDGRLASSDDKINEQNIRPIWTDAELYTIKANVELANNDTVEARVDKFVTAVIKSRKKYKGSGTPTLYTTEDVVTDCLLAKDAMGHRLYKSVTELATELRVKEIVTVEAMENATREADMKTYTLMGLIVNLDDYNVGADKGGAVNMFDDFDIDYNQQKYLIETRCSGALVKPFSAIAVESTVAAG